MDENMGINELAMKEFKRAFRWLFDLETKLGKIDNLLVKSVDFPNFEVENHKRKWKPIAVEYYDAPEESTALWNWLLHQDDATWSPKCTAWLTFLTGTGATLDGFRIIMNLKEFTTTKPDYASSEPCVIRLVFDVMEVMRGEAVHFRIKKDA